MVIDRRVMPDDPAWLKTAFYEIGQQEWKDPGKENPRIVNYHAHTTLRATTDEVPWCSSFCCFVMETNGIKSTNSAASLSWLNWGRELETPKRGCIVIFDRRDREGNVIPGQGHCGYWLGEENRLVTVLGGNQSDQVGINRMRASKVLSYRWPTTPTNSTTNMATVVAGLGTAATAAPTIVESLGRFATSADAVASAVESVDKSVGKVSGNETALVIGGVLITLAALWHIVRERLKKIRDQGI